MSDDRISPTPTPAHCPLCEGAISTTFGVACPACGRTSAPADQVPIPDFRLPSLDGLFGYDKGLYFGIGTLFTSSSPYSPILRLGSSVPSPSSSSRQSSARSD